MKQTRRESPQPFRLRLVLPAEHGALLTSLSKMTERPVGDLVRECIDVSARRIMQRHHKAAVVLTKRVRSAHGASKRA